MKHLSGEQCTQSVSDIFGNLLCWQQTYQLPSFVQFSQAVWHVAELDCDIDEEARYEQIVNYFLRHGHVVLGERVTLDQITKLLILLDMINDALDSELLFSQFNADGLRESNVWAYANIDYDDLYYATLSELKERVHNFVAIAYHLLDGYVESKMQREGNDDKRIKILYQSQQKQFHAAVRSLLEARKGSILHAEFNKLHIKTVAKQPLYRRKNQWQNSSRRFRIIASVSLGLMSTATLLSAWLFPPALIITVPLLAATGYVIDRHLEKQPTDYDDSFPEPQSPVNLQLVPGAIISKSKLLELSDRCLESHLGMTVGSDSLPEVKG